MESNRSKFCRNEIDKRTVVAADFELGIRGLSLVCLYVRDYPSTGILYPSFLNIEISLISLVEGNNASSRIALSSHVQQVTLVVTRASFGERISCFVVRLSRGNLDNIDRGCSVFSVRKAITSSVPRYMELADQAVIYRAFHDLQLLFERASQPVRDSVQFRARTECYCCTKAAYEFVRSNFTNLRWQRSTFARASL